MSSAENDHPLRADPLQALPDAVRVPRRPRKRPEPPPPPPPSSLRPKPKRPEPPSQKPDTFASLLTSPSRSDPLLSAVAAHAGNVPTPPAGNAFATDINEVFAHMDDPQDEEPPAAGIVHRDDVTLLPAPAEKGAAAGVYLVRSRRNWAFGSPQPQEYYIVRRSIADFSWLEHRLRTLNQGVIVPSLPSMALAGRMSYGFNYEIERMRGLQVFLRRVATHPVLSTCDHVLSFLGATGEDAWRKLRAERIIVDSSITSALFGGQPDEGPLRKVSHWGERFLWQAGRTLNNALVNFLDKDNGASARKDDSPEARLERLRSYVQQLGMSLASMRHAAATVATNRQAEMRGVAAMQDAMRKLGTREGGKFGVELQAIVLEIGPEEDVHSEVSSTVGGMSPARIVDDVFLDYEERAKGAQMIMNARKEEQDAYEHALAVYTRLRDDLESRTGSMWEETDSHQRSRAEGMEELVNDVNAASRRLVEVRKQYQAVALTTTEELRRLRRNMHDDMCEALRSLADEYSRQHAAHAAAWGRLAERLAHIGEVAARPE